MKLDQAGIWQAGICFAFIFLPVIFLPLALGDFGFGLLSSFGFRHSIFAESRIFPNRPR
jgi:hypothetical protein